MSSVEEVNDEKSKYFDLWKGKPLREQVARMHDLQKTKAAYEEELKEVNLELDVLRMGTIPEKMEDEGVERISFEGIGRVSLTADMFVATPAAKKGELYKWLDDHGFSDLIQSTVNASTLKAWVKGRMKAGEQFPEECIRVTPFTRATITKS